MSASGRAHDRHPRAISRLAALRTRPPSSVALVVGHTNTVPEIIAGLGGPADVTIDHDEFDRLFVLSGTRLTRLRYGA